MVAVSASETSASSRAAPDADPRRSVRLWLLALIFLTFAMVLVGGVTRLTESGLSITEWNLVTGTLPPLTEDAWQAEFERYRATPQYDLLNRGMSLGDFRTIYWWEWAHRELGRFIGLFYIGGFLWLAARRLASGRTLAALAALGGLLAAQGLVGWIMVMSGLEPGMIAVAPVKLALHLTLASLFFAALVVMFVRLGGADHEPASLGVRLAAWLLVLLGFVQIALGGLVAGHDAGRTYNTWPLMDGRFVPRGLGALEPAWLNLVDNIVTIQFNHRIGAYVLAVAVLLYAAAMMRGPSPARGRALLLLLLVVAQVAVGIATLIYVVPLELALMHQGLALVLLLALAWNASVFRTWLSLQELRLAGGE
ncbi:MAG: COX15/CtaA family protein [Propylenella sp.]